MCNEIKRLVRRGLSVLALVIAVVVFTALAVKTVMFFISFALFWVALVS